MARSRSWIACRWLLVALAFAAHAGTPAIRFAQPVKISADSGATHFDAYGRRFSLTLTDNERVLQKIPAARKLELSRYKLLRGTIDGAPGSWVRLTQKPDGVEGAFWDGHDLYTVAPYERIAPWLTNPLDAAPGDTVVYRLSDATDLLPQDFCAVGSDGVKPKTALDQYKSIVGELTQSAITPVSRQIEISLIADSAFQAAESDPTGAMLTRLNVVEGIFSQQLGLLILATDLRLIPAGDDPFTSTNGATLLDQLGAYRSGTAAVRARGLAHLLTGKDLDGTTAGIAYVGSVCDVSRGVGVSERSYNSTISALIMAHELGHNFGADHDGDAGGKCPSVSGGYIMAPSVGGFSTFSQCSVDSMTPVIAGASCVTSARYADVIISSAPDKVTGEGGAPFTMPFVVQSAGNQSAENVTFTATLPDSAAYSFVAADAEQGTCSLEDRALSCSLGTIPAGAQRTVTVTAVSRAAASFWVEASVSASNDGIVANNDKEVAVTIRSGVDARVTMSTSASEVPQGGALEVDTDVTGMRTQSLHGGTVSVNLNQPVLSASMPGALCTVNASSVTCSMPDISQGETRRLAIQLNAVNAGPLFASANVTVAGDGDLTNNTANATAWVQAEQDAELTFGPSTVSLGVGAAYQIPFVVRSRGTAAMDNLVLLLAVPTIVQVDDIDAGTGSCTRLDATNISCPLGTLAPGDSRTVILTVHGGQPATTGISASVPTSGDGYLANNSGTVLLSIDNLVDLSVAMAAGGFGIEGVPFDGQVSLRSSGRQSVAGATLDVDLHSAGQLRAVSIHNGAPCSLLADTHARCALPSLARNAQVYVDYTAQFSAPGSYDITFTGAAPGDTAPDNDTLTRAIVVRPDYDIGVSGALDLTNLPAGAARDLEFTVTSGPRALSTARFVANNLDPGVRVEGIRATAGECRVDANVGGSCDFTDLPADSKVAVSVTYRADAGSYSGAVSASVLTVGDVASANDSVSGAVSTQAMTDVELRVAGTASGARASSVSFPTISLVNGAQKAFGTRLEVTLPADVTLLSVSSANAICSGTSVVRCDFSALDAGSTSTVAIAVSASASGQFVSNLKITSNNDDNASNDSKDVTLDISASAISAQATSGPKSGGGSLEWLTLAMLLVVVARKWGHADFPGKGDRPL